MSFFTSVIRYPFPLEHPRVRVWDGVRVFRKAQFLPMPCELKIHLRLRQRRFRARANSRFIETSEQRMQAREPKWRTRSGAHGKREQNYEKSGAECGARFHGWIRDVDIVTAHNQSWTGFFHKGHAM